MSVFVDLYLKGSRPDDLSEPLAAVEETVAALRDLPAVAKDAEAEEATARLARQVGRLRDAIDARGEGSSSAGRRAVTRLVGPDHPGRDAGHHAPVGNGAADHRTGRDHDVAADARPWQDDRPGPQRASRADPDGCVARHLTSIGTSGSAYPWF